MACDNALTTLAPNCAALKKKGGFDKRFWVGSIADIDAVTYGTDQEVTALTFTGLTGLKTFTGKRLKHGGNTTLEAGEVVNQRLQNFLPMLYAQTAAERASLELLADAEDIFIFAESNAGVIEIFGINKGDNDQFDNYGMKCSAAEWKNGVLLNDDTSCAMTFTGAFDNAPLVFAEGTAIAANIIALDALVVV